MAGALLAPLKWFFIALLLLARWIVDWIFVFSVWPAGLAELRTILSADLARASQIAASWGYPRLATDSANFLYALLFTVTGIHDMATHFSAADALSIPDTIVRNSYISHFAAIQVAMVGTQLLGVRFSMLAMSAPIAALVYCVSAWDGFAQRAIRTACGGRESASLYHRAKHLQVVLSVTGGALILLLPTSIDPRWIALPVVAGLGLLVRLQWTYYKKHL